jgi:hypothetical protein
MFYITLLEKWNKLKEELNFKPRLTNYSKLNDSNYYKVKAILAYKIVYNKLLFLVK